MRDFWKSAGLHLTAPGPEGWLAVTPDFIRAYLTRPEVHPIDESCAAEIALHEALLEDPYRAVSAEEVAAIADEDARETYGIVLRFRDALVGAGTIEGAYLRLIRAGNAALPPVFFDQLVHLILRNALKDVTDPMRLRAAELFFRDQTVSTDDGRIMLADEEIVEMHARTETESGLARLLAETATPMREVQLDVLTDDNRDIYWARSDRFDTVIDFRFEQPALDAFARVVETWVRHMLRIEVRVQPMAKIQDRDWRWHIGLDKDGNDILNALYEGRPVGVEDMARIIGLFRMTIPDERLVIDRMKRVPIYMALAMSTSNRTKMKPQNLLMNLPLTRSS